MKSCGIILVWIASVVCCFAAEPTGSETEKKSEPTAAEKRATASRAAMGDKLLAMADGKRPLNDLVFEIHELTDVHRKIQIHLHNRICAITTRHGARTVPNDAVVEFLRFIGPLLVELRSVASSDDSIKGEKCARLDICDEKIMPLEWTTVAVTPAWKNCDDFWKAVGKLLEAYDKVPDEETIAANSLAAGGLKESVYDIQLAEKLAKISVGELPLETLECSVQIIDATSTDFDEGGTTTRPRQLQISKKSVSVLKSTTSKLEISTNGGKVELSQQRSLTETTAVAATEVDLRSFAKLLAEAAPPAKVKKREIDVKSLTRRIKRVQIQITVDDQHGTLDVDTSDPEAGKRMEKVMDAINGFIKRVGE